MINFFNSLFVKNDWSKWQHVCFVNSASDVKIFQLFVRHCRNTGLSQYRKVIVASGTHLSPQLLEGIMDA